ncbi:MAG: hypothetical protein DRJ03_11505 [Chloroflexi bacterium]|nr:MAG: hypothetical protein DRJ03_11505 [Chloroflexota bacterium]
MYTSEVEICNLALASIGEADITSLTEETKRARLCSRYYAPTRDQMIAEFDWPFARKTAALSELSSPVNAVPEGMSAYSMPSDCVNPLDILPLGSREEWVVVGRELMTTSGGTPTLRYTSLITATGRFSAAFGNILALGLAARLCSPLTQDKGLAKDLYIQYLTEKKEAWAGDASIGVMANPDDDPNKDTFVTGGDTTALDLGNQRY